MIRTSQRAAACSRFWNLNQTISMTAQERKAPVMTAQESAAKKQKVVLYSNPSQDKTHPINAAAAQSVSARQSVSTAQARKEIRAKEKAQKLQQYESYLEGVSEYERALIEEPKLANAISAAQAKKKEQEQNYYKVLESVGFSLQSSTAAKIDSIQKPLEEKEKSLSAERRQTEQQLQSARSQLAGNREKLGKIQNGYHVADCDPGVQAELKSLKAHKRMSNNVLTFMDKPKEDVVTTTNLTTSMMENLEKSFPHTNLWAQLQNAAPTAEGIKRVINKIANWYAIIGVIACILLSLDTPIRIIFYPFAGIAYDLGFAGIFYLVFKKVFKRNGWGLYIGLFVFNLLNASTSGLIDDWDSGFALALIMLIIVGVGWVALREVLAEPFIVKLLSKFKYTLTEEYIAVTEAFENDTKAMVSMYSFLHHEELASYLEETEKNTNTEVVSAQIRYGENQEAACMDQLKDIERREAALKQQKKTSKFEIDRLKRTLEEEQKKSKKNPKVVNAQMSLNKAGLEVTAAVEQNSKNEKMMEDSIAKIRAWDEAPVEYTSPILNKSAILFADRSKPFVFRHNMSSVLIKYCYKPTNEIDKNRGDSYAGSKILKDFMWELTQGLQRINPEEIIEIHHLDLFGNGNAFTNDTRWEQVIQSADRSRDGNFGPGVWLHTESKTLLKYLENQRDALVRYVNENRERVDGLSNNIAVVNEHIKNTSDGTSRSPFTYKIIIVYLPREDQLHNNSVSSGNEIKDIYTNLIDPDFCEPNGIIPVFAADENAIPSFQDKGVWSNCVKYSNVEFNLEVPGEIISHRG